MKIKFWEHAHLSKTNMVLLNRINNIIEDYAGQGYRLTLRQLYYQLVASDVIANLDKEYKKLSSLLKKGRMGGIVDWKAIEDRLRKPYLPYWVEDTQDAINDTITQYRLNRQKDQEVYIEVWVEKDALSGVLRKITSHYHINLMVNRGYSSCSAMFKAYERFKIQEQKGKELVILYLGDHDPSGLDMIRDIKDRLIEFGVNVNVKHIGITMDQINDFNPPPNPAKITDPRAKWYIQQHGNVSWEVDALNPKVLHELVKKHVEELIDMDLFQLQIDKESIDIIKMRKFAEVAEEDDEDEDYEG